MSYHNDEVSLKYILLQIKDWFYYLLSKWLILLIAGIIGGSLGLWYAYSSKPTYTAPLSFILSNNDANAGLMGLASQFGVDLGTGGNDAFMGDNIISLMTSRNMVQKAMLQKAPQKNETLINMLVKDMKLNASWDKYPRTKGSFPFPDDAAKMTYVQDSLCRGIYEMVRDNFLTVDRPDKTLSVYAVSTTCKNELFSHYLTTGLVNVTSRFYIDTKTSVARNSLNMLMHEADSMRAILGASVAGAAKVYDNTYNLNPAYQVQRAPAQEGQLRVGALATAYGEVLKNLELAKISLQKETPLYQIIDEPHLPLVAKKPSKLIMLLAGGILAGILVAGFFIVRRVLKNLK